MGLRWTLVSTPDLERLRRMLAERKAGGLPNPVQLRAAGLESLARAPEAFVGFTAETAMALVDALLAERRERITIRPELVWTGPEGPGATARDTAVVVRELFSSARQEVLLAGFRFDHAADILAPLHGAMKDVGARVQLFVDPVVLPARGQDRRKAVEQSLQEFLRTNWPFGAPIPELFYDARLLEGGAPSSMHAKCLVVDVRWTLLTSANFTDRGQTRNIEAGVLLDDPSFAVDLLRQWRSALGAGHFVQAFDKP